MSCSMTKMLTSQTIIISLAVISASVSSTDASHSLRGTSTIYIDGDVTLMHLIGKVNNTELRRLNELVPTSKAIRVPCHNETSDCGIHGQCRISGNNRFCHCDGRYVSLEIDKPCDAKGANQMVMLIMWIMFGWTGGSMFGLGLSLFGTLVLCCVVVVFASGEWVIQPMSHTQEKSRIYRSWCIDVSSMRCLVAIWTHHYFH